MPAFSIKGLLGGLGGGLGSVIGNPQFKKVQRQTQSSGFPTTLNKTQLWLTTGSDITVVAGSEVRIGEYTIPAQQRIHLGYGVSGGNPEEIGGVHFDIMDDTATNSVTEAGKVRIGYTNANGTLTCVVADYRTERVSDTSASVGISRSDYPKLPETPPSALGYPDQLAMEDSKIFVTFESDAADIIVETAIGTGAVNYWELPVTIYQ